MNESACLDAIDAWLKNMADGLWEHHNGITIESTDNPGWMMRIDLANNLSKDASPVHAALSKLTMAEGIVKDGVLILYSEGLASLVQGAAFMIDQLEKREAD